MVSQEKIEDKCEKSDETTDIIILTLAYAGCFIYPIMGIKLLSNKLNDNYKLLIITLSVGLTIIGYFYIYLKQFKDCAIFKDPLNKKVFQMPYFNFAVSHWPITHYILYCILAYLFPLKWLLIFLIGTSWEIIESLMKIITKKDGKNFESKSKRTRVDNTTIEYTTYWDSSYKDIAFNSAGILTGLFLRKYLF